MWKAPTISLVHVADGWTPDTVVVAYVYIICSFVFKSIFLLVICMICVLPLVVINDDYALFIVTPCTETMTNVA